MDVTEPKALSGPLQMLATHPVVELVADRFAAAGIELALVGGSVRDALLGDADFDDLDFATPAGPDVIAELLAPLGSVFDAGARFGTIGAAIRCGATTLKVEVTQFRTESYDEGSRKPQVTAATTLREDLARRDLTINAAALRLSPGEPVLVDPFDGAADLAEGVIRTPSDPEVTFSEDPLRILRVVRFAARFGFVIADATEAAARRCADRLRIVAAERVTAELRKVLALGAASTADAMAHARRLGVSDVLFGGLPCDERATEVVRRLAAPELVLPALAQLGDTGSLEPLRRLKLRNDELDFAAAISEALSVLVAKPDLVGVRRLLRRHGAVVDAALEVGQALGRLDGAAPAQVADARQAHPDLVNRPLPVDGNDALAAGLRGREIGLALQRVEDAFLDDPDLSRAAALAVLAASSTPVA